MNGPRESWEGKGRGRIVLLVPRSALYLHLFEPIHEDEIGHLLDWSGLERPPLQNLYQWESIFDLSSGARRMKIFLIIDRRE